MGSVSGDIRMRVVECKWLMPQCSIKLNKDKNGDLLNSVVFKLDCIRYLLLFPCVFYQK